MAIYGIGDLLYNSMYRNETNEVPLKAVNTKNGPQLAPMTPAEIADRQYQIPFVKCIDYIVKKHLGQMEEVKNQLIVDTPERQRLEAYIHNSIRFVNTWSNALMLSETLNKESAGVLWNEIRSDKHDLTAFVIKVLTEVKNRYTGKDWNALVEELAHGFTVTGDREVIDFNVADESFTSTFPPYDYIVSLLRANHWLVVVIGISMMETLHE